jgi:hypothetical protein
MRETRIKILQLFLSVIMAAAVWGCAANTPKKQQTSEKKALPAELDTPFALTFSKTASLEDGKVLIEFADVTEDSRCPVNVTCVWEGQATVALDISREGKSPRSVALTSRAGHEELAVADIDGYSLRLVKVEPPKTREKIELDEYIITLTISKIQ